MCIVLDDGSAVTYADGRDQIGDHFAEDRGFTDMTPERRSWVKHGAEVFARRAVERENSETA